MHLCASDAKANCLKDKIKCIYFVVLTVIVFLYALDFLIANQDKPDRTTSSGQIYICKEALQSLPNTPHHGQRHHWRKVCAAGRWIQRVGADLLEEDWEIHACTVVVFVYCAPSLSPGNFHRKRSSRGLIRRVLARRWRLPRGHRRTWTEAWEWMTVSRELVSLLRWLSF